MKKQKIRVVIAEKPYSITVVSEQEEQTVRAAAKRINDKINKLTKTFQVDINSSIAMAALEIAIEREELDHKLDHSVDKLQIMELNDKIEKFINQ